MSIVERLCKTQIVQFGLKNLYDQPQRIKTTQNYLSVLIHIYA